MSPTFMILLGIVFIGLWGISMFFYSRISRQTKAGASARPVAPVYRLADQWLAESQKKVEDLIQRSEAPLSAAQNELLELRLEASRLPQGVKSLTLVRESLASALKPSTDNHKLVEVARSYLGEGDCREGKDGVVFFRSPLGEMPCLEVEGGDRPLTETQMRALLPQVSRILAEGTGNHVGGGFLYFANDRDYQDCSANEAWMTGLKSQNLMVLDLKGLVTLLISLRLSKDVAKVIEAFDRGVESTAAIAGQTDHMAAALTALSADSLKAQTVMGETPGEPKGRL